MSQTTKPAELLMCDFCSWEDDETWIHVAEPKPDALLPYNREGFSLCGFDYRSLEASRWLVDRRRGGYAFGPAQDRSMFANIQRAITLGRDVTVPRGESK